MDVEGGRAVGRRVRTGRLAAVVAVQNLLVVSCLMVTVYLYMTSKPADMPEDNVYIQFKELKGPRGNMSLRFDGIKSKHGMECQPNESNIRNINIKCTGPYVWHMHVQYNHEMCKNDTGTLVLQVNNNNVSSITLNATHNMAHRGLYSIVYLAAEDVVTFHMYSPKDFRLEILNMGLSYMLGNKCEY